MLTDYLLSRKTINQSPKSSNYQGTKCYMLARVDALSSFQAKFCGSKHPITIGSKTKAGQ